MFLSRDNAQQSAFLCWTSSALAAEWLLVGGSRGVYPKVWPNTTEPNSRWDTQKASTSRHRIAWFVRPMVRLWKRILCRPPVAAAILSSRYRLHHRRRVTLPCKTIPRYLNIVTCSKTSPHSVTSPSQCCSRILVLATLIFSPFYSQNWSTAPSRV